MRYLDVCAGISASSVAWQPLGREAAAYSEIAAVDALEQGERIVA
jgi:site-specific DNA-cytosine methylase